MTVIFLNRLNYSILMNKKFGVVILGLMMLSMFGIVSATPVSTIVGGTIYQDVIANEVSGASVEVICHHSDGDHSLSTTSLSNGEYSVIFFGGQCAYGDLVDVNAEKGALTGENDGKITMTYTLIPGLVLDVGVVNVPMVPEFGAVVGVLTVLGALGMFFVVRRK
jgi:hypothetical protein